MALILYPSHLPQNPARQVCNLGLSIFNYALRKDLTTLPHSWMSRYNLYVGFPCFYLSNRRALVGATDLMALPVIAYLCRLGYPLYQTMPQNLWIGLMCWWWQVFIKTKILSLRTRDAKTNRLVLMTIGWKKKLVLPPDQNYYPDHRQSKLISSRLGQKNKQNRIQLTGNSSIAVWKRCPAFKKPQIIKSLLLGHYRRSARYCRSRWK